MPRKPFKKGEARPAKAGRRAGTPNRITAVAKETIEAAAEALGGFERLAKWAKASKKNEYAFWTVIFPKLLPLHAHGPGQHGARLEPTEINPTNGKGN